MAAAGIMQSVKKDLLDDMTKAFALLVSLTYVMGLIIVNSFLLTRHLVGNRERLIVWSAIYTLILLAMMVVFSTFYGRTVYNDILPTVGGGAGNTISFVTDIDNTQVLEQIVPMSSD